MNWYWSWPYGSHLNVRKTKEIESGGLGCMPLGWKLPLIPQASISQRLEIEALQATGDHLALTS